MQNQVHFRGSKLKWVLSLHVYYWQVYTLQCDDFLQQGDEATDQGFHTPSNYYIFFRQLHNLFKNRPKDHGFQNTEIQQEESDDYSNAIEVRFDIFYKKSCIHKISTIALHPGLGMGKYLYMHYEYLVHIINHRNFSLLHIIFKQFYIVALWVLKHYTVMPKLLKNTIIICVIQI